MLGDDVDGDRRRRRRRRAARPRRSSTSPAPRAGCCAAARCRLDDLNAVLEPLGADPDGRGLSRARVRGVPPGLPGRRRGHLPADRRRPRDRAAHRRGGRRSATATSTPSRSPTSAGWRCSAAWWRRTSSPASCRSCHQRPVRLPRRRHRADRRRDDLRGRGARRPVRARRADQARRPGARGRLPDRLRRSSTSSSRRRDGSQFSLDPAQGALLTVLHRGRDGQRGELRRRPRRPRRRRGRHRGARVLRLLLPARQPQRRRRWRPPARCSAPRWPAPAPASCRTTSIRRGCSWATAARC